MIVQRTIVKMKPQNHDAVVEMLKAARAGLEDPNSMRILTSFIGVPYTTVVFELTNQSLENNRANWDEWYAQPESDAFMEKWLQLIEYSKDEYYTIEA